MEPEVVFERVAPVIPVRDLDAAMERYRRLGFQVERDTGPSSYAFVDRGPVSMHLHGWRGWDRTGGIVYLYVSDADALHAQWSQAGVDGRFGDPHDTDYGLREFEYTDPEGTVHRVGSPLVSPGTPNVPGPGKAEGEPMRFAGATVIITGAAGGLGSVMASAFAAEGGRVMLLDLPSSPGEKVREQINRGGLPGSARFVPCDLADLDRTGAVIAGIVAGDGVSVLVNNAAIYPSKPVDEYSIAEWQSVQRVNVDAAFVCAQAVLPAMRAAGSGRIVNISSITFFGGLRRLVPYVTSKGALVGLTRALARECGADGITVNAVAPGAFPTAAEEIHPDREGYNSYVLDQQAVKRRGVPGDVANAVLFFSAPESSFITGQLLCVDGGWIMH